ncbi:MAG TPA: 1-(5-phosphoribosyl)-5-[(5-phosphoribosylamino)methylideneamino]imidazole-4-carboxamide isomerase [Rudaea sp.]|nr:1-(5-phosphoribosyl)-5-[(5-phosphoribosylamino)methylideneamino]imidazole-4-carboxamide isomerase [Rudaea sp.]
MEILPAIDLRDGRVVRLAQGDYSRETRYGADPVELAERYRDDGARWLHLVDLDGARDGSPRHLDAVGAIARCGLSVQAGGGVRGDDDVRRLLDAGAARVVIGSLAVTVPEKVETWISHYGSDRICIALDARLQDGRRWTLPVRGWTAESALTLDVLAPRYAAAGARHVLCTDIARDGVFAGPNLELYAHLAKLAPTLDVQASGGVRDAGDVRALRAAGVAGVVLGRSLLEGRLTLAEALAC